MSPILWAPSISQRVTTEGVGNVDSEWENSRKADLRRKNAQPRGSQGELEPFLFFFVFLELPPWHKEVPRLGVELDL